jgi:serine/threonine protein kinase
MDELVGRKIDNYRIEAILGQGGMGAVFRAYDVNLARYVALKVMHRHLSRQAQFKQRFLQEAQAIARLSHPSIVTIYSFDSQHGLLYIVMEYIEGLSLGGYIKELAQRKQVVQLNESLNIIAQSADALGYAHRHGVVHRDIKPDNVLIKPLDQAQASDGPPLRAVLTDFGLAKLLEGGIDTATGTFMGTLPYMSPEQALAKPIDGRSDIYSLGVVLYQLATGRLPFDIKTPTDAVMKHLKETPPEPRQVQPGLPEAVQAVIASAMAKKPEDRFQKGEEFAHALRQAMTTLTDQDVTTFATAADYGVISLLTELESAGDAVLPSRMEPEDVILGGAGTLIISRKGQRPQTLAMDKQTITIGRGESSDVVLTGQGISRRHARLERMASGWMITDLGSTNGTFLDDARLLPDMPEPWSETQTLRVGPFFIRWQRTKTEVLPFVDEPSMVEADAGSLSVPTGGTQILSSTGQLSVVVSPTNVDVDAGGRVDLQVELLNQGMTVDHFQVGVQGLSPSWVTVPQESLRLMPGTRGSLPVSIHPPQDSSAGSGQHRYRLAVTSMTNAQETATVTGTINIRPFERFTADIRPKALKVKGISRVLIRNDSNFDATYRVGGQDPGEAIRFDASQKQIKIPAGNSSTVDLTIESKNRPFMGRSQTLPFTVNVTTSSNLHQSIPGQLEVRPVLPRWLPALLGALLAILCLATAGVYYFTNQGNVNATATVEALANSEIAVRQTEEALGTISAQETAAGMGATAAAGTAIALTAAAEGDDDGDGLSNSQELSLGTDPQVADTDGDGLSDGEETLTWGTNPQNKDHDGDTLSDGDEVLVHGTSPINPDTDGDGTPDGVEISNGSDPLSFPTVTPAPEDTPLPTPTHTALPTAPPPPTLPPTPTRTATPTNTPPPALDPDLIAYYPLSDNAADATGNYGPITLQNAPYQDGGVFCNGVYQGAGSCRIITPQLNSFDYNAFSISVRFKVSAFERMPVFVGGNGWRWIGFYLNQDGSTSLLHNNSNYEACTVDYQLNTWHTALVTYDGSVGRLYLDRVRGCSVTFALNHGNDKNVGAANFANAQILTGFLSDLRIYKKVITPLLIVPVPIPIVTVGPIVPIFPTPTP